MGVVWFPYLVGGCISQHRRTLKAADLFCGVRRCRETDPPTNLGSHTGRSRDIYGAGVGDGLAWDTPPPGAINRAATHSLSLRSFDVNGYPQVRPYPAKYRVGATGSRLNMSGPTINRGPTPLLSTHEERWTGIGGRKLHVARLTIAKGQWLRVRGGLSRMPTFGAAIGTASGQRVATVLAVAMAVAQHRLEVADDDPADTPGISIIDQLLDLVSHQFIALDQCLGDSRHSLAVFLEQALDCLEL